MSTGIGCRRGTVFLSACAAVLAGVNPLGKPKVSQRADPRG